MPAPAPAPHDYVRRTHLDRIRRRLVETAAAIPARWRLSNAAEVRVNGLPLRGMLRVADALAGDRAALEMLTPDRLVRTPGEPHRFLKMRLAEAAHVQCHALPSTPPPTPWNSRPYGCAQGTYQS
ncbi:hypothetical protein KQY30_07915 [Streptomyces sp. GMY02]|uniref:hypothetical protein n=1 Tax=Streptomyces sp. GMY02 TaxID=1333528 RepID=UPI001C2CC387|nr:hypothetical protein [Streptomyces sp. GMY02]QXE34225.1 hypothetical protein KQY30_07915 [Streptomyces sp. GMY02]